MNTKEEQISAIVMAYFSELERASMKLGQGQEVVPIDRYFARLFYKNRLRFTVGSVGTKEIGPGLYGVIGLSSEEGADLERLGAMLQGICIASEAIDGERGRNIVMDRLFDRFGHEWSRAAKERGLPESEVPGFRPRVQEEPEAQSPKSKSL